MPDEDIAILGGGCFWCLQAVFDELNGVLRVECGYAGGTTTDPNYEQVCSGSTGHAEVVRITFDPKTIAIKDILDVFFTIHDPTTVDRQGDDVGSQYRSVVFYRNAAQHAAASQAICELVDARLWDAPVVTQVVPFTRFYPAEEYHQDYFKNNPRRAYCQAVIAPKVAKARRQFLARLKTPA